MLVIGDEHAYGCGLSGGNLSYVGHFIRQISRSGRSVSVEAYAHLTLTQTIATLAHLPLSRYDLILLQLDQTLLQPTSSQADYASGTAFSLLPDSVQLSARAIRLPFWNCIKLIGTALLSFIRPPRTLTALAILLDLVRPYRHNVLLLTPLPYQKPLNQWLHRWSRTVLMREADKRLVSMFDTASVIQSREEYFLPNDSDHLNAISHELLGRSLFDFYQSAPTIVTIQDNRRG